jgi:hypothetical protein
MRRSPRIPTPPRLRRVRPSGGWAWAEGRGPRASEPAADSRPAELFESGLSESAIRVSYPSQLSESGLVAEGDDLRLVAQEHPARGVQPLEDALCVWRERGRGGEGTVCLYWRRKKGARAGTRERERATGSHGERARARERSKERELAS